MDKGILQRYSVWAKESLEQQVEVSLKTLGINSDTDIARAKRTGDVTTIEGDPNSYSADLYQKRNEIMKQVNQCKTQEEAMKIYEESKKVISDEELQAISNRQDIMQVFSEWTPNPNQMLLNIIDSLFTDQPTRVQLQVTSWLSYSKVVSGLQIHPLAMQICFLDFVVRQRRDLHTYEIRNSIVCCQRTNYKGSWRSDSS